MFFSILLGWVSYDASAFIAHIVDIGSFYLEIQTEQNVQFDADADIYMAKKKDEILMAFITV